MLHGEFFRSQSRGVDDKGVFVDTDLVIKKFCRKKSDVYHVVVRL